MKYIVAFAVPPYVKEVIKEGYLKVTGRKLPASNLHISLIYPFFIHSSYSEEWVLNKLKNYDFISIDSRLSDIDVFRQEKDLLYVSVEPENDYLASYLTVNRILRPGIHIDTKPFLNGELPDYVPHIGIDYDFNGDHLTLHSLKEGGIGAMFESGQPRLYRFDENIFEEI